MEKRRAVVIVGFIALCGIAVAAYCLFISSDEKHLNQAYGSCVESSGCKLLLTGRGYCGPCDLEDDAYQCVTPEEYTRIKAEQEQNLANKMLVQCAPCPNQEEHKDWHCVCDDGKCYKAQ